MAGWRCADRRPRQAARADFISGGSKLRAAHRARTAAYNEVSFKLSPFWPPPIAMLAPLLSRGLCRPTYLANNHRLLWASLSSAESASVEPPSLQGSKNLKNQSPRLFQDVLQVAPSSTEGRKPKRITSEFTLPRSRMRSFT